MSATKEIEKTEKIDFLKMEVILDWKGKKHWKTGDFDPCALVIPIGAAKQNRIIAESGGEVHPKAMLVLSPGINRVPMGIWNLLREEVTLHIESGGLVETNIKDLTMKKVKLTGKEKTATTHVIDKAEVTSLKDMNAAEAMKVIQNCFNMESLEAWMDEDIRDAVIAQIKIQIEKLKKQYGEDNV